MYAGFLLDLRSETFSRQAQISNWQYSNILENTVQKKVYGRIKHKTYLTCKQTCNCGCTFVSLLVCYIYIYIYIYVKYRCNGRTGTQTCNYIITAFYLNMHKGKSHETSMYVETNRF